MKLLLLLIEKDTRLCLASSHTSQWKCSTSRPLNKERNKSLIILNDGCLSLGWWSHTFFLLDEKDFETGEWDVMPLVVLDWFGASR